MKKRGFPGRVLLAGAALCGLAQSPLAAEAGAVARPSVEAYFAPSEFKSASLSPSGRWLLSLVGGGGMRDRLVLRDLEDKEPDKIIAVLKHADVASYNWVNEDWITFSVSDQFDKSVRGKGRGLLAVNRSGERIRLLIRREFETSFFGRADARSLEPDHFFLANGKPGSNEVIIGAPNYDPVTWELRHVTPLAMDITNGTTRRLVENSPDKVRRWVFDSQGRVRAAMSDDGGQMLRIYWSDDDGANWRKLAEFPRLHAEFTPAFVDQDGQLFVHVASGEAGEDQVHRFDFGTGKPDPKPWIVAPGFDADVTTVRSAESGKVYGLQLTTEARSTVWLTPYMRQLQAQVDAKLAGRVNLIDCERCEPGHPVLVYSYTDRDPGQYLLFRPHTGQWERLGRHMDQIDPGTQASVRFERIKARDGQPVPTWITGAPREGEQAKPAVVLVHGGPWVRGFYWEWEPKTQFLASRGYVVIAPEFRGSSGYGDQHERAGWRQWGQSMQDDLSDALKYAVDKGWVDAKRVCIMGASYGGYAALMGLAKDPDQYRCGVAWAAVTDPTLMYTVHWSDFSNELKSYSMPLRIGDPVKDADMLSKYSPLKQVGQIKAPVLIAHGGRDRRVPIEHGRQFHEAMTALGKPHEWVVYDDEGHGWYRDETKFGFWRQVETFLAKHLTP